MTCLLCQDLLQQRLDGLEPAAQAALDVHLRVCPECRALLAAAARLQTGLRLLPAPRPPAGLAGQIAARLQEEHQTRRRRRQRLVVWGALAAAVLLVLAARFFWPATGPEVWVKKEADPGPVERIARMPVEKTVETMPLRETVSEVGSAVASAAARTADATVAESRYYLPLLPDPGLGSLQLPAAPEPDVKPLREAGQGVSGTLAPVADSLRRGVDLFLRDLGPMSLEEKPGL